ncbi:MAG: flagellar hook-length control protein FliK [Oscillospiraceae bacterium]|nr:flagellar hook-length control protein FliK [Oscillospiraceae bacterium]
MNVISAVGMPLSPNMNSGLISDAVSPETSSLFGEQTPQDSSETAELLPTETTFAACLQNLKESQETKNSESPKVLGNNNVDNAKATQVSFFEEEQETDGFALGIENEVNGKEIPETEEDENSAVPAMLERLLFLFERVRERAETVGGVENLTKEDWRELLGGTFILLGYNATDSQISNGSIKKQFDEFVEDIIAIFSIYMNYSKGEINEAQKLEAIRTIVSKMANKAGTEEVGTLEQAFDQQIWELIIRFIETIDPAVNPREWVNWSEELKDSATKGGKQPLIETVETVKETVQNQNVQRTQATVTQPQQQVKQSDVPNVQGETNLPDKNDSELPKAVQQGMIEPKQFNISKAEPEQLSIPKAESGQESLKFFGKANLKDFSKDITEYKVTRFETGSEENPDKSPLTQLKQEVSAFGRPIIVREINLDGIGNITRAESFESEEFAVQKDGTGVENLELQEIHESAAVELNSIPQIADTVSGQNIALQVSGSIAENLEKIILQATGLSQNAQSAEIAGTTATANVPRSAEIAREAQVSEFKITLNPEHLGKVTVKMVTTDDSGKGAGVKVAVQIIAASEQIRDLLLARAGSVRVMIERSGVTVERYDVITEQQQQTVTQAGEMQRDLLDDRHSGGNQQNESEGKQDGSESEPEQSEMSFSEMVQAMI